MTTTFMETTTLTPTIITIAILLALWTLPWKGYALWLAARKGHKWWFIILLVLNTVAILEILYIFIFSKKEGSCCKTETKTDTEDKIIS